MTLQEFLRNLSSNERTSLAEEIEVSGGYLRLLSSNPAKTASIELTEAVLNSDVNLKLPEVLKFTEIDYMAHRRLVTNRRVLHDSGESV